MKPEEFAKQFFDLWQQSAGQMMRDPAFSQKMLEMMQQSGQFWQPQDFKPKAYDTTPSPSMRPASHDGHGTQSVDELAHRLELCEQRLAVIEALSRQWSTAASQLHASAASGGGAEE
jgi:hypothetical protein